MVSFFVYIIYSGAPNAESGSVNYNGTFTISTTTPTRSGYDFNGWCTVDPSGGEDCSGTEYSAGQTVAVTSPITLTLYARWRTQGFTLTYSANTTDALYSPIPNSVTGSGSIALTYLAPVRTSYRFDGWCSVVPSGTTCSGTKYAPGDSYALSSNATLYAIWAGPYSYTLQNISSWKSTLDIGDTVTATDSRDSQVYAVGKLKDGNVWLLDNLSLGSDSSTYRLTSSNSNVSATFTLPKSGTDCFIERGSCTNGSGTSNSTDWASYIVPAINSASKTLSDSDNLSGVDTANWKYGVYYNYAAASAGTITGYSNSTAASYDICPKGWRMPTGDSDGEYVALDKALGGTGAFNSSDAAITNIRNALHLPFSGYFYDGSTAYQSEDSIFWSPTPHYSMVSSRYVLSVYTFAVYPNNSSDRNYGLSVRRIAK